MTECVSFGADLWELRITYVYFVQESSNIEMLTKITRIFKELDSTAKYEKTVRTSGCYLTQFCLVNCFITLRHLQTPTLD